eukprot:TRINITY_DN29691_c0_g1_i1.p1 TRINITY_DN29691_c0_g1~~TRINITY_DN29691_c0_g1_i1.p1  ORF type:complete len:192 (+),score=38.67 TRINITY_DN29691_c0_g1_i1:46-621(+)
MRICWRRCSWHLMRVDRALRRGGSAADRCWRKLVFPLAARHQSAWTGARASAPPMLCLDHAALGVRDLGRSVAWYGAVLGMRPFRADDPQFSGDIAMVKSGDAALALLLLPPGETPLKGSREQRGHAAMRVDWDAFVAFRSALPELLEQQRQVHPAQSLWIEEMDYGVQKSLFFLDPDGNELEITTWVRSE